jgi:hypothetical protein
MPYLIRRPKVRRLVCALAGVTAFATAAPAVASACTVATGPASTAFSQFGDSASYVLAPGGSFESGTPGWTLNGAAIQSGNESFGVGASSDSHSLSISPNGDVISAPICVSIATPTFRFFAERTSGSWAQMNVNVLWTDAAGVSHSTTAGSVQPPTDWAPTSALNLGSTLPLWQPGSTLSVRLEFDPNQWGGGVAIDDLYIDPYSR